jgi:hypothetical protein
MAATTLTTSARLRRFGANSASWRARTAAMSIAAFVSLTVQRPSESSARRRYWVAMSIVITTTMIRTRIALTSE